MIHDLCFSRKALSHKKWDAMPGEAQYDWAMEKSTAQIAGERIAAARSKNGYRLKDVCQLVPGLTTTRLSNWEQGIRMISVDEAKRLAPVLGVSAAYLLTIDDSPGESADVKALVELYKKSDDRGRATIIRVAEQESHFTESAEPQHIRSA